MCASAAFAQGKIVVKNPDGSTQELELPEYAPKQPVEPAKPKVQVFKAPEKPSLLKPEQPRPDAPKPAVEKAAAAPKAKPVTPPKPKRPAAASNVPPKPESPGRVVKTPQPMDIPEGQPITEKLAKRIALRIAPPARDINVYPRTFEGKDVYLVRFKTDEGFYDVLVDMLSGDILATKQSQ